MERVKGIEPSSQAWEAHVLPLNHTRFSAPPFLHIIPVNENYFYQTPALHAICLQNSNRCIQMTDGLAQLVFNQ